MSSREQIDNIHIVRVTKNGTDAGYSALGAKLAKISPQGFVSIDSEFSGLGQSQGLKDADLPTRYEALREIAHSRAIFSVGISIFDVVKDDVDMTDPNHVTNNAAEEKLPHTAKSYEVSTFELLLACQTEFSMSSDAGQFLVSHSFDFNEMFKNGIPYARACSEKTKEGVAKNEGLSWKWGKLPQGLLWRIGRQGVPLIVHNGWYDLAFLYAAFQAPLPDTLNGFIKALLECVPAGYWDTKILAAKAEDNTSFLSYLFAKAVIEEQVSVSNAPSLPSNEVTDPKDAPLGFADDTLCALYSFRGFCHRKLCPLAHDPFRAVEQFKKGLAAKDSTEASKRYSVQSKKLKKQKKALALQKSSVSKKQWKKRLEKKVENGALASAILTKAKEDSSSGTSNESKESSPSSTDAAPSTNRNAHSAGWDAFCTGYIYAAYQASIPTDKFNPARNRIALPFKGSSLFLCRSEFGDLDIPSSAPKQEAKKNEVEASGKLPCT